MELHRITSEEYCTFCLLRYFIYKNTNSTVEPSCLNRLELRKLHERQMFDLHMLWYELIPFILIQTWLIHLSTQADGTDTLNQRKLQLMCHASPLTKSKNALYKNNHININHMTVTWHTAKYGDPFSFVICALHLPIQSTHTRSEHTTHTVSSGQPFMLRAPGEQLRVQCLAQGQLSRDIEGESALYIHPPSPPPPHKSCRPETRNSQNLWSTSPTL